MKFFSSKKKQAEHTPLFEPSNNDTVEYVDNSSEVNNKLLSEKKNVLPRKIEVPTKTVHFRILKHIIHPLKLYYTTKYVIYTIQYTYNKNKADEYWNSVTSRSLHSIDNEGYFLYSNHGSALEFEDIENAIKTIEYIKESIIEGGSYIVYEE